MATWAIVLIVVGVGGFMFLGLLAVIAVPALQKYMRRAKTAEAKVQLAKIYDGVSSYYKQHGSCPNDGDLVGSTGPTPPLSFNCNEGPGGRCIPDGRGSGSGPGYYSSEAWSHPVWNQLNYVQEQGHYFHYSFVWANNPDPYDKERSSCQFTVQAFGDLDDDGIFSTFERSGAADAQGVNAAAGLFIDMEVE